MIGFARIGARGEFALQLDTADVQDRTLVFEAAVDPPSGTTFRTLAFASLAAGAGAGGDIPDINVLIDPISEAAVRVIDDNGLETFDESGVLDVEGAVREATADLNFSGLSAEDGAVLATDTALADPTVQGVINTRRTPTAGPSPTPTATLLPNLCEPEPLSPPPGVTTDTIRFTPLVGQPGTSLCLGAVFQPTAGDEAVNYQFDFAIPTGTIIPLGEGGPECAVNPNIVRGNSAFDYSPPGCNPSVSCTRMRVLIREFGFGAEPLPDGTILGTCRVEVKPDATPGTFPYACNNAVAADALARTVQLDCPSGTITILGN